MAPYELARGLLDPGLFSDNAPTMQAFYTSLVGLPFIEALPHSPTYAELMYQLPPGKLKIQAFTEPLPGTAVTGYRELWIAKDGINHVQHLTDPDGLSVKLVPRGYQGVTHAGFVIGVPDPDAQERFYVEGMGAVRHEGGLRVGDTQLMVREQAFDGEPTPCTRRGFVYSTVIVHDCYAAHDALLKAGAQHSLRVLRLADRCLFSWVRDPSGTWVEVVQYAALSGPLPDVDRLADHWDEVIRWREEAVPV